MQLNGLQVAVLNWSDFGARDEAAAAIEYALLSALIALIALIALATIGSVAAAGSGKGKGNGG